MTAITHYTGHPIHFVDGEWRYEDTGMLTDEKRPCKKCGKIPGDGGIDPCLMPLIASLNGAGFKTIASCCGHGFLPASVILEDGREVIVARSWKEARMMTNVIGYNINGGAIDTPDREESIKDCCECGAKLSAYEYSDNWKYCPYCSRKIYKDNIVKDNGSSN